MSEVLGFICIAILIISPIFSAIVDEQENDKYEKIRRGPSYHSKGCGVFLNQKCDCMKLTTEDLK